MYSQPKALISHVHIKSNVIIDLEVSMILKRNDQMRVI